MDSQLLAQFLPGIMHPGVDTGALLPAMARTGLRQRAAWPAPVLLVEDAVQNGRILQPGQGLVAGDGFQASRKTRQLAEHGTRARGRVVAATHDPGAWWVMPAHGEPVLPRR